MFLIRSGIPSLDLMFHPTNWTVGDKEWPIDEYGISLDALDQTTSICIAGPDGTGKSVLAMHFASRYLADCHQYCRTNDLQEPHAFYISTDLSLSKAQTMWKNFHLREPNMRRIPFRYPQLRDEETLPAWLGAGLYDRAYAPELTPYEPDQLEKLADYLYESRARPEVAFVDLASHTAGDDWGFTERLLAAIPKPQSAKPRDIVLIDAMEGMETLTGEVDAFGEKVTRRGRVAKLMRLASHKCHVVFIVEEPQEKARTAEQFVADVVLRLRATEDRGYSRRTIEIEKARGQSHVRGRHPYVVRDGRGSTTGEQINFDDPRIEEDQRSQSYLDVYPSLHSASRVIMENRAPAQEHVSRGHAGFGIEELDDMLAKRQANSPDEPGDDRGLPCGAVSALIGDANTQKSFLGHAFLGYGFYPLAAKLVSGPAPDSGWSPADCAGFTGGAERHYVNCLCTTDEPGKWHSPVAPETLSAEVCRWASRIHEEGSRLAGASVLITTKDENHRILVKRFFNQLEKITLDENLHDPGKHALIEKRWEDPAFKHAFAAYLQSRTICRRLEIHDTPSAVLFHVMRRAIEAAQQIVQYNYPDVCLGSALSPIAADRAGYGWRIRFVLDDFNSVMRTYGRIHDDPLFLPFLMLYLRREGLSSLIIETQAGTHGMPATTIGDDAQSDLRALSDYRLYTWHITGFFGDHRIAIAAIPPMVQQDSKSPVLVRELEWYDPSQKSPAPRVNPRFELYTGLDTNQPALVPLRVHLYAESSAWESYIQGLDEIWMRVFEPANLGQGHRTLVVAEKASNYDLMREVAALLANTNLPYSLVIQIDEFWHHREAFRTQAEYWKHKETAEPIAPDKWFDDVGYRPFSEAEADVDRIPFIWDFGFLACRFDLWTEALGQGATKAEARKDIRRVWNRLRSGKRCQWAEVLRAASYVAKWESTRQSRLVPAFDLAMMAPETFSCLVLEIWFSEICQNRSNPSEVKALCALMERRSWKPADTALSLAELVAKYEMELYCTWLLLAQSLNLNDFGGQTEGFGFAFGRTENPDAILTRHWYKSAAGTDPHDRKGSLLFSRLPGYFSTRGDWFLTTVRGSRSDRLADRALDLLSTCGANGDRLMRGLGLPTRKLRTRDEHLSSRLRGRIAGPDSDESTLSYHDVRSLGVTPAKDNFHWLWRGNLKDYESAAHIWERWLYRILRRWKRTREHFASDWYDGFWLYDIVKEDGRYEKAQRGNRGKIPKQVVSITDFPKQCRILRDELQQAAASARAQP